MVLSARKGSVFGVKALILVVWIGCLSGSGETSPEKAYAPIQHERIDKAELQQLREGDVLLRRGIGFTSDHIARLLDEQEGLTHCGLLVKKANQFKVISCESTNEFSGVLETSLAEFLLEAQPNSLVVVRPKSLNAAENKEVAHLANWYLKNKKPFDLRFDNTDTTAFYCVEFLDVLYKTTLKKELFERRLRLPNGKNIYLMANFFNDFYFKTILNHQELETSIR